MSRRTAAWLAYSTLVLVLLLGLIGSVLMLLNGRFPPPSGGYVLAFLSFLAVGVLVASRRPENPIGWMFCIIALAGVWEFFAQEYAFYALVTRPGALPAGVWLSWSTLWSGSIEWVLMFFALLLFPDGGLPSPRWRPFAWFAAGVFALEAALTALEPGRLSEVRVPNPTGIERAAGIIESSTNVVILVFLGIVLAICASVIVRFRRSRGEERQQLKWLAYSAWLLGILGVFGVLGTVVLHSRAVEFAAGASAIVGIATVPAAVGVAILRYRLYEIDLLINYTLVYGSLTAMLVALYLVGIVVSQRVFVLLTGQRSTLAVVASTLLIAALFNPLRHRIQ